MRRGADYDIREALARSPEARERREKLRTRGFAVAAAVAYLAAFVAAPGTVAALTVAAGLAALALAE